MNRILRQFWASALVASIVTGPVLFAQETRLAKLTFAGSELLGEAVSAVWAKRAEEAGIQLVTKFQGSRPARDTLAAGIVDVAVLIAEPQGDETWPDHLVSLPLAHVAAFVIAPQQVSLDQLSYEDLALIFGADSAVTTTRWGDFGATGSWASIPITTHVTTPAEGLAYEIFRHRALPSSRYKVSVREHNSLENTLAAMGADDGGIAVVPWIPEGESDYKALLVAPAVDEVAFGPTAQNMAVGDYPLIMSLRLVFERERAPELLSWLKYWYGDEVTAALRQSKLMPLPRTLRNQQVFDLEVVHRLE